MNIKTFFHHGFSYRSFCYPTSILMIIVGPSFSLQSMQLTQSSADVFQVGLRRSRSAPVLLTSMQGEYGELERTESFVIVPAAGGEDADDEKALYFIQQDLDSTNENDEDSEDNEEGWALIHTTEHLTAFLLHPPEGQPSFTKNGEIFIARFDEDYLLEFAKKHVPPEFKTILFKKLKTYGLPVVKFGVKYTTLSIILYAAWYYLAPMAWEFFVDTFVPMLVTKLLEDPSTAPWLTRILTEALNDWFAKELQQLRIH